MGRGGRRRGQWKWRGVLGATTHSCFLTQCRALPPTRGRARPSLSRSARLPDARTRDPLTPNCDVNQEADSRSVDPSLSRRPCLTRMGFERIICPRLPSSLPGHIITMTLTMHIHRGAIVLSLYRCPGPAPAGPSSNGTTYRLSTTPRESSRRHQTQTAVGVLDPAVSVDPHSNKTMQPVPQTFSV